MELALLFFLLCIVPAAHCLPSFYVENLQVRAAAMEGMMQLHVLECDCLYDRKSPGRRLAVYFAEYQWARDQSSRGSLSRLPLLRMGHA